MVSPAGEAAGGLSDNAAVAALAAQLTAQLTKHKKKTAARRRVRCRCRCTLRQWLTWSPTVAIGIFLYVYFFAPGGVIAGIGKCIEAFGRSFEGAALVASTALDAGSNITISVASAAYAALSVSKSVADDAYSGVDLVDVSAQSGVIRAAGSSSGALAEWVRAGGGGTLLPPLAAAMASPVASVTARVPVVQFSNSTIDGIHFHRWYGHARLLPSGYFAFAAVVVHIEFKVKWCNQVWTYFGFEADLQYTRILRNFHAVADSLQAAPEHLLHLSDECIQAHTLPAVQVYTLRSVAVGLAYLCWFFVWWLFTTLEVWIVAAAVALGVIIIRVLGLYHSARGILLSGVERIFIIEDYIVSADDVEPPLRPLLFSGEPVDVAVAAAGGALTGPFYPDGF